MLDNSERDKPLYEDGAFRVSHSFIRTPRINISLADVDLFELRQPLLWMSICAVSLVGILGLRFFSLVYWSEMFWFFVIGGVLIYGSSQIGIIKINSLSMNDEKIIAPIGRLRKIRAAIEVAMDERDARLSGRTANRRIDPSL